MKDLATLLKEFPIRINLEKREDGTYGAYCAAPFQAGTVDGKATPEEAVQTLLDNYLTYKNNGKRGK